MSQTMMNQRLNQLLAPQRNNYYYGKLLDENHFRMEQDYINRKRWLLNRLGLGAGVLCGLEVIPSDDRKNLCILPGVAIDALGREIIVPEKWPFDPWEIRDDCKNVKKTLFKTEAHEVIICLTYNECYADYAPVLVTDCIVQEQCAPGTIRESFCVRVCEISQEELVPPEAASTTCTPPVLLKVDSKMCESLTGTDKTADERRVSLCENLSGSCSAPDEKPCVVLATVQLKEDGTLGDIQQCEYQQMLYSNATLFEMILCLTECCGGDTAAIKSLVYVSGDNQEADVTKEVPNPLVVQVLENKKSLTNEDVVFEIRAGGGQVGPAAGPLSTSVTTKSDNNGLATLDIWRLGPTPAQINRVVARLASGEAGEIMFLATTHAVSKRLVMVDGDGQQGVVNGLVPNPLVIKVELLDAANTPVAGETVTFSMIEGDGKIGDGNNMGTSFQTDSQNDGLARLPVWRLGPNPGVNRVSASIANGTPREYIFHADAVQEPVESKKLVYVSGDNQTAAVGQKVQNLVVQVLQGNNSVANESVTFDMIEGGGQIGDVNLGNSYRTASGNNGEATLPVWELGANPGVNRVSAHIISGTPNEYVFHAFARSTPDNLVVVEAVEFLDTTGIGVFKLKSPNQWPTISIDRRVCAIRVSFNKDLNPTSLPSDAVAPFDANICSFLVQNNAQPSPYLGTITVIGKQAIFTRNPLGDPVAFDQGEHWVTLFGDQNTPARLTIRAVDGSYLDGERVSNWTNGPFSGNGQPGGNFVFNFTISP